MWLSWIIMCKIAKIDKYHCKSSFEARASAQTRYKKTSGLPQSLRYSSNTGTTDAN